MNNPEHLFNNAVKVLDSAGFESPVSDTRRLLNHCLGNDHVNNPNLLMVDNYIGQIFNFAIRRRLSYEPISHIVGYRDFWKSRFFVDQSVLDPRPETELIVDLVRKIPSLKLSVLDLGTGTGCLAVSIALEKPDFKILASDISSDAIRVAKLNAKKLGAKVEFVQSDWFSNINQKFDIIVSNPPYVCDSDMSSLPISIQRFEPRLALEAGRNGLDSIKEIAFKLNKYLNPKGVGIFEIGNDQQEMIKDLFNECGFNQVDFHVDLEHKNRVVCVKKDA